MELNDNTFSLLKLLAEAELQQRRKKVKTTEKTKLSSKDTNDVVSSIDELLEGKTITIGGQQYEINATNTEDNSILLWLWGSNDEEKTIKLTFRIDELKVDSSYWSDDVN